MSQLISFYQSLFSTQISVYGNGSKLEAVPYSDSFRYQCNYIDKFSSFLRQLHRIPKLLRKIIFIRAFS